MSTNVLLPLLIIALSIFFAFTAYLRTRTRSKSQPKVFRLQIPKKKKLRSRRIEDVQKNDEEKILDQSVSLTGWHNDYEETLLTFFERADTVFIQTTDTTNVNNPLPLDLPNVDEAAYSHPSREIGVELTALAGIVNTGYISQSRKDQDTFAEQKKLYFDYRSVWLSRLRQYVNDFERLIHLRKPLT